MRFFGDKTKTRVENLICRFRAVVHKALVFDVFRKQFSINNLLKHRQQSINGYTKYKWSLALFALVVGLIGSATAFSQIRGRVLEVGVATSLSVYPGSIGSSEWSGTEHVLSPDLDEYALYQEFSARNSAYVPLSNIIIGGVEIPTSEPFPDESSGEEIIVEPERVDDAVEEIGSETTDEESTETTPPEEVAEEVLNESESIDGNESVPDVDEPVEEETEESVESEEPITFKQPSAGLLVLYQSVTELFPFLASTDTSTNTEATVEPNAVIEPAITEEEPASESVATSIELLPEVDNSATATNTEAEIIDVDENEVPAETDSNNDVTRSLILRDFDMPKLNEGEFITSAQLRLSLGASYEVVEGSTSPTLEIYYKTASSSELAGTLDIDQELSNAINGGYFLFGLPMMTGTEELSGLEIEVRYKGDIENLDGLYLDAAWLEIDIEEIDKKKLEDRIKFDALNYLEASEKYTLLSDELDFTREELPYFHLRYNSQRNVAVRFVRELFGRTLMEVKNVSFVHTQLGDIAATPQVDVTEDGLISIRLNEEDQQKLRPGEYFVEVTVSEGGTIYTDRFAFQWGLLSINPDQTTYKTGSTAHITMGALSSGGNTVCDAALQLFVIDESDTVYPVPVSATGVCNGNNVVDTPDYIAEFIPGSAGLYTLYLERLRDDGSVMSHTSDTFYVKDNLPLFITRNGPTRIYPVASYPMEITVTTERAYRGTLIERVPLNFVVSETDAAIATGTEMYELSWDIDMAAGESETFSYIFDTPDISPYLYKLGTASLRGAFTDTAPNLTEETEDEEEDEPAETEEEEIEEAGDDTSATSTDEIGVADEEVSEAEVGEDTEVTDEESEVEEEAVGTEAEEVSNIEEPTEENPSLLDTFIDFILPEQKEAEAFEGELLAQGEQLPITTTTTTTTTTTSTDPILPSEEVIVEEVVTATTTPNIEETDGNFEEHRQWQIASDAVGSMILFWSGASIPSGWTCVSCAPADVFYQRFIMGSSTTGINGGGTTHTHTASAVVNATAATGVSNTGGGGADVAIQAHTHTMTPTIGSASNLPSYRNLVVIQHNSAGSPATIPTGAIAVFDAAVPSGWTQYSAQNNFYTRAFNNANVGTTGGSNTHTHTITGTTGAPNTNTNAPGTTGVSTANNVHTHTISSNTAAESNEPPFIQAIYGQLNATSTPTDAMIAMWSDEAPAGWSTVSSTSQPFSGRFIKGSATYGTTGGATSHAPANVNGIVSSAPSAAVTRTANAANADASGTHTHSVNVTGFSTDSYMPPYRTALFAKRNPGGAGPAAPTVHRLFDNELTGTSTPALEFTGADPDGVDTLVYQVQWDDDEDVNSSPIGDRTSDNETGCSPNCFENRTTPADTNPYNDGERVRFTIQSALSSGTTYYWRVRVKETVGNTWSSWSTVTSFTYRSGIEPSEWLQTEDYQFSQGVRVNVSTSSDAVRLTSTSTFATPVVESFNSNTAVPGASLSINKPTGVVAGDLLLIIVGNDDDTANAQWDNNTLKPDGFTLINESGNTTADTHAAAFYRVADGTEPSSTTTPAQGSDDYWGYYLRVSGVDPTTPINVTGVDYNNAGATPHNINAITTTVNNALAFYVLSADGGDTDPYSVAGPWVEGAEITAGTGGTNSGGTWGTRLMTSSGGTGNAAVTMTATDGASGFTFALRPARGQGSLMSPEIDFSLLPGQSSWGEILWDTVEPAGTDTKVRVYHTNSTTCDTLVPDSAIAGNAVGFDVSEIIFIDNVSTTTYDELCLQIAFDVGTGTTSPQLNEWNLRWQPSPRFTQSDFLWYANTNAITPTDPWPVGDDDLLENEAVAAEYSINTGDVLRLRMSLSNSAIEAEDDSFTLQYAAGDTCSLDLAWYDVGAVGSTTAPWRGYNNAAVADGATISSLVLINSDVGETYEESNDSSQIPNDIAVGEVAEWDWVVENNNAAASTNYCFRMVNQNGEPLFAYTNYPTLITNSAPNKPILYRPFDNEKLASTSPHFEFVALDDEGNTLNYQIQVDNNADFSSTVIDTNSISNLVDFTNIPTPADKAPFNNAERIRYVTPSTLSNNTTYWWRVRSVDTGSGSYGDWATSTSFTVDTTLTISTWFQTTEQQFDTDTLWGTNATAGNLVAFASGSTTGTTTSTAIEFADATIGNAWGAFSFNETGAANNILYHLEYFDGNDWQIIPNAALPGNVAGFDTSPVSLVDLDSATYNIIRIRANFQAGSPTLLDWTIAWGERVSVPTHQSPFDNEKFSTTVPFFLFSTTDPQNQDLEYQISWSTNPLFTSGTTTRSSNLHSGFTNVTSGGDTTPFNSGNLIQYQIQPGDALSASSTYWWRVRARDPAGSNSYSFWSSPWSFTTATSGESVSVATWFQTTGAQFANDVLDNASTTIGTVTIGGGLTVRSFTTNSAAPAASLSLNKPTGVEAGDLLLIIVGNDDDTATAQWNNTNLKPQGFTLINEAGNATPDAHVAAFYRVATGLEPSSTSTTAQGSDDYFGYYLRVTGIDTSSPINVTGADDNNASAAAHTIPGITTTVNGALAFYALSADGADTDPFSVAGPWTESAETQAGTTGTNAAGTWGTRLMTTAGATGNAVVTMAVADGAAAFTFALRPAVDAGSVVSQQVDFDDGDGPAWGRFSWRDTEAGGSQIIYHLEYLNPVGIWETIPDIDLANNSTGFTTTSVDLQSLDTDTYDTIRIAAELDCNGGVCPSIQDWTISWSPGFTVAGRAYEYNGTASTTSGTVAIAINGVLQSGKTATISNGLWSIPNVTYFDDDIITVFVDGATDANEAVAVTKYDGSPGISGMRLQKRHLSIGSDDLETLTNDDISHYDFTNDEDIFFDVNAGDDIDVCATTGCFDASIRILPRNIYSPGTGADVLTHDLRNDGTFTAGSNSIRVSGSWDNNATTTMTGSTVIMTATTSTESIDQTGAISTTFNNLTFGETSGAATWNLVTALDVDGNLSVNNGTFNRNGQTINIAGNLATGASGSWSSIGTTTFDGVGVSTWTDSNVTKQNIGRVAVDGSAKTLRLNSDALARSMWIGVDDTFDSSSSNYDISIFTNWINLNTFTARQGTVFFIATTSSRVINAGGDAFYDLAFNGSGGGWSFTESNLTISNDLTISAGTVTLPTATTTIVGSFTNSGGTFAHNNGHLYFISAAAETLTLGGSGFNNLFRDATFQGTGSWTFTEANATTSNDIIIVQGAVTLPSGQLAVGGTIRDTGGSFNPNNGTVRLYSTAIESLQAGGSSFYNLTTGAVGSWSFSDTNVTITNNLTLNSGTTTLPSGTLSLAGSLDNNARFIHNNGTVLFNSNNAGETVDAGNSSFYNLTFNHASGGWTINANATSTNNTTLTAASSFTLASSYRLNIGAVFTNSVGGAATTWTGSTLSLNAGNYSLNTKSSTGDTYGTLRVAANTDIKMWNSSATTYSVDSTGSLYSQDHNAADGDLYIFGNYVRTSGTEYWSYATDFDGTALGGSSRQVDVRFGSGASADFTTATLQILGTNSNETTIERQSSGYYGVSLVNSTINAEYYEFSNLNASGLVLNNGTIITSLENGDFNLSADFGASITISTTTIDANPGLQIFDVTFDTTHGTTTVTTSNGDNTFLFFDDFVDGSINAAKWTKDIELGSITETGGYLRAGGGITSGNYGHTSLGSEIGYAGFQNNSVIWRARNSTDGIGELVFRGDFGGNLGYKARFDARAGANGNAFLEPPYTGWTFSNGTGTCTSDSVIPVVNQWYTYQINAVSTNFMLYRNGSLMRNCTDATFAAAGEIALQNHYGSYTDYDWVAVRPLVSPEPTYGAWAAEQEPFPGVYRENLTINGTAAGAQTNYVLPITVNFGSGSDSGQNVYCDSLCNGDFSDIRFREADGTELSYWREESYTASSSAVFWVKFNNIPASPGTTNIYMYYGNTSGFNVLVPGATEAGSYVWFRDHDGNFDGEAYDSDPGAGAGDVRWDDSPVALTISGTVYSDDGVTPIIGGTCNGVSTPVRVVVSGDTSYTGSCSAVNGSYSISGINITGSPVITVYLDGASGGQRATTITKTPLGNITNLNLYTNRVITRHEDVTPITIADMAVYDFTDDADIPFTAASTTNPDTLTVRPNFELHVASSTTFAPAGTITLPSSGSGTTYDGTLHLDNNAIFTGSGTSTYSIGGSLILDTGVTFTSASSTVVMTATTSGKTITASGALTLNELQFNGVGGSWNLNTDLIITDDIYVQTGTVSGTEDVTLVRGSFYGNGLVSLGTGTTTLYRSNTLGGTQGWTFGNLRLGNGLLVGTTTPASNATTTVLGRLSISAAHYLDSGNSNWNLAGTGTVFVETGNFLEDTSTVTYSGAGASNILSTNYYNLRLNASAASPTYTSVGSGIQVLNNLLVGVSSNTTVNFNTNDTPLNIDGDFTIGAFGIFVASNSGSLTLAGDYDNNGTFTSSSGTVTFDTTTTSNIAAGNSSFGNVVINGSGSFTISETATTSAAFTLTNASNFTLASGQILAVGGTFTNGVGGGATTWTGSTLKLFSGTNYQTNPKTINDSYNNVVIGANTDVRIWNSSAATYSVNPSGSLYSQDHNDIAGDLYIYGNYPGNGGNDYWSYATDFDGTALGGGSRQVDVRFESGASMTMVTGGLQVLGTASATTTIDNQGSGTYGLRLGGTASTTWSYYSAEDMNTSGITFSGSPNVVTLAHGDIRVTQGGGSAITVGGGVINNNPAKTFSNNVFSTSSAIAAYNVTATGTSISSWRFTNHNGNIDGEAFDNDPTGDPGYIVWDDSSANITISGNVYSDEGVTVSTHCDGSTNNVRIVVAGLTGYSTSCNAGTGFYSISGISYSPNDPVIVFLDGESDKAANVTADPVSNIASMHLYHNRVIVRHENSSPLTIDDMALWDSSDDGDIPFTAVNGSPDTLTLPANRKLLVWTNKSFTPGGNVTLSGGGGGSAYDGTLELLNGATFTAANGQSHSVGGSLLTGVGATFDAAQSTTTFTTTGASRTIDINNDNFYNARFTGAGSWNITDNTFEVTNDLSQSAGTLTLPAATSTIGGSFNVTGGSFNASNGLLYFTATDSGNIVRFGGSTPKNLRFNGIGGSWIMSDTNATSSGFLIKNAGSLTLPSGVFTIADDFINVGTLTHNSGTLRLTATTSTTLLTLGSNNLNNLVFAGASQFTMTDPSATLLGRLTISNSANVSISTTTLTIGGSLNASGGVMNTASGTILFNSSDAGETINPGNNPFYNVIFANATGGWTISANATTTNNFTLTSAASFTQAAATRLYVGRVFTNSVGGNATNWTTSNLVLGSGSVYAINTKTAGGDQYSTLTIGANTDITSWNSRATTTNVSPSGSWASHDHGATDGRLNIYGDYHIATTTNYWSYATDFDGTALVGGARRAVTVYQAANSTTTLDGGALNMIGAAGATTTVTNQGSGNYAFRVNAGTINASYYAYRNLNNRGLNLSGQPTIISLNNGDYELAVSGGNLISLSSTTLNANASLVISNNRFATTTAITGKNVNLTGVTGSAWTYLNHSGNFDGELFDNDGGDECGSVRWTDSSCLLTEQTHYRWRNDDGGLGVPDSEWFNLSWGARARVRVTNSDLAVYNNVAVKVPVTYDADMQADFDDLRFTDASGTTSLPYWIESYTASTEAIVWVNLTTLPANATTDIFMYYDNIAATSVASSGAVFIVHDDFEDDNILEYSGDTSLFNVGTTFNYGGTYGLDAAGHESSRATDGIFRFDQAVSQGEIIRYFQYIDTAAGANDEVCTLFAVQSPGSTNLNYAVCLEQVFGVDRISIARNVDDADTSGVVLASKTVAYAPGWYEVEIDWQTDDSIDVTLSQNGSLVATTSATDSNYTSGGIGFTYWFQSGGWDNYTSRPRVENEPAIAFGAEQYSGGATWAGPQNSSGAAFDIGEKARLRLAIENSGLTNSNDYRLEYAEIGAAPSCEAVTSGNYATVPVQASCGSSPVCMATSTNVANGEVAGDLLFNTLGTFSAGSFIEDPSNTAGTISLGQNEYTELEYAVVTTNNVAGQDICFRVSDAGSDLDTYLKVARLSLKFDPTFGPVTLNGGQPITLTPGATTTIYATSTVTDLNGYADLVAGTSTIYRSGAGAACVEDNNNCYISTTTSQCSFTDCSGNSCTLSCMADIYYHADPTDDGTYVGQEWLAYMEASDASGASDFGSAVGVELLSLRALDVENSINYGALEVSANTGSYNASTTIENLGNASIDVEISGTNLTDGGSSVIPATQQIFATSTFTYSSCVYCQTLSTSSINYEVDITKPTVSSPFVSDVIYWGIEIPFGVASNPHNGNNTFSAISDN